MVPLGKGTNKTNNYKLSVDIVGVYGTSATGYQVNIYIEGEGHNRCLIEVGSSIELVETIDENYENCSAAAINKGLKGAAAAVEMYQDTADELFLL